MIFIVIASILCVAAGAVCLLFLKVERESLLAPQETYLRDLFSEIDALLPPAEKLASYSVVMANARHRLRETDDTDEFLAALVGKVHGLSFDIDLVLGQKPAFSSADFGSPTGLVERAHALGFRVYTWTARVEQALY